ncbi:sodium:proton exchanger [Candidatus Marinamargulisbacteria bacterium SCGC AG-410-N11]|nr:sodium:proton exchanger [Candidatus Marinamargulisbacteria bacterium SCGC AG-410-N11]
MISINIFIPIALLVVGFALLWKGGELLVDSASSLASRAKIPPMIIGLTLVSFGTSAPELFVNIIASVQKQSDIILGNIIGSNIANTLLILGLGGLFYPKMLQKVTVKKEIIINILVTLLLIGLMINPFWSPFKISHLDSIILILALILFMFYLIKKNKTIQDSDSSPTLDTKKALLFFSFGCVCLPLGGYWVIESAIELAQLFKISEACISLFAIAIGTSLPELATTIIASLKKKNDLALGNIIGSNIFNILLILGISGLINPIIVNPQLVLDTQIACMAVVGFLIMSIIKTNPDIKRFQSLTLFVSYWAFIIYVFYRG